MPTNRKGYVRVDLQSVMKQLKAWEHPKMRAVNAKHGAGENQFGVNLGKLRGLCRKIKRDHTLALELWKSGNIDAMNLATLIMDPKQLTQPEVEKLAKDLSYYTTTDWLVKNVIKALPFKGELCRKWAASKEEYVGRAGWTLMAGQLEDNDPEELLDTIEKRMKAAPFRTQEPMNVAWSRSLSIPEVAQARDCHRQQAGSAQGLPRAEGVHVTLRADLDSVHPGASEVAPLGPSQRVGG